MRDLIPAIVGGHEEEAEIVHIAVVLASLNRRAIANGLLQPKFAVIAIVRGPLVKKPHHARQKPFAPIGPNRTFMLPAAIAGIHRIKVRMVFDELANLVAGEAEGLVELLAVGF